MILSSLVLIKLRWFDLNFSIETVTRSFIVNIFIRLIFLFLTSSFFWFILRRISRNITTPELSLSTSHIILRILIWLISRIHLLLTFVILYWGMSLLVTTIIRYRCWNCRVFILITSVHLHDNSWSIHPWTCQNSIDQYLLFYLFDVTG